MKRYKVLVTGSGGREHAIVWKLSKSEQIDQLFVAPGNAGTAAMATNLPVSADDFGEIRNLVIEYEINMLIVGPEAPLVNGIRDLFENDPALQDVIVIGPGKQAAQLEGSKAYAKVFMRENNIPTAAHRQFEASQADEALAFLDAMQPPYVIKADGLAAGKGVIISNEITEAREQLLQMLKHEKFGEASKKVVIEEYLDGIEVSVFVLTDGKNYLLLPEAKDYKRIGEGDTGLNTGGMGSVSPVGFADAAFMKKVEAKIIKPTLRGLANRGIDYRGFIFFGLMKVAGEPYVIEYNVRLGDPEAESILPRIKNDLIDLFVNTDKQSLDQLQLETDPRSCTSIVLVSGGYPGTYKKGIPIKGLSNLKQCVAFHAGTTVDIESGAIKTNGGRVLCITSLGNSLEESLKTALENAERVSFEGKYYRRDIGKDLSMQDA